MSVVPERLTAALADRYRIERELGAGGMATVYLAEDVRHRRHVALKVIRPDFAAGMGAERFLREIHLAAGLHHPNILPLYDSGDADGFLYYVMPVAEGESLSDRLGGGKRLSILDAVRLGGEVADALDYAHRHGVIHRDIKPGNILLHEGHALITDFGIGKALVAATGSAALTQTGLAIGTPAYMSPEQAGGDPGLDGRSDLYSLGCVLYEMLAGSPPFTGATVAAVIAKRFTEEPPDVRAARADVPAALSDVVLRCLAREPDGRYATGAALTAALGQSTTSAGPATIGIDSGAERARSRLPSVAVLPFANMSTDPQDEFFADGITEEIINALAQIDGLQVPARTSCFAFQGKHEDLRSVGEKLGVQHVLEGSVRKAGSRVRITAQLISADNGYHLWSERYDRELHDIFALQDELAGAIAAKLKLSLLPRSDAERAGPRNLEAYQLLLKGRALLWKRGRAILDAIPVLEQAVALDPELGDAHGWLGDAWRLKWLYGMAPAAETIPPALAAIDRALAIDADNPQALAALANIRAVYDLDRKASLALSDRALARDPRFVQALCERAVWQSLRPDVPSDLQAEALRDVRTARALDPLSSWAAAIEVFIHLAAGRNAEAVRVGRESLALDPAAFTGRWVLVWSLSAAGHQEEALALADESLPMSGRNPRLLTEIAAIHARRGNAAAVSDILNELTQRRASGFIEACVVGCVAASAGDLPAARALIAQGIAEHEPYIQFARSPAWAAFRADPAGMAMLQAVAL